MLGSASSICSTERRICSGVLNDGRPHVREAAPLTMALRIAISLIAEMVILDTFFETQRLRFPILPNYLKHPSDGTNLGLIRAVHACH